VALGTGNGYQLGDFGGEEETIIPLNQLPAHLHDLPGGGFTDPAGGSQPFSNLQPYLSLNYLINVQGVFPCLQAGPGCDLPADTPFLGEIMLYAGGLIPNGWALANGQLLSISQNQALFSLLGTNFGGNGQTNFALPDLRGRTVIGTNLDFPVGTVVGQATVTLNEDQMPTHVHDLVNGGGGGGGVIPEPGTWALLNAGFGAVGWALRRRGRALRLVAA